MPNVTLEDVSARCESLQAQCNRIQRWGGTSFALGALIGALALGAVVVLTRDRNPDIVKARRFEVVGGDGVVVGVLGMDEGHRALLELRSASGSGNGEAVRVGFESGPEIALIDADHKGRLTMSIREEVGIGVGLPSGSPAVKRKVARLQIMSERGNPAVELVAPLHGPGEVTFYSSDGDILYRLPK